MVESVRSVPCRVLLSRRVMGKKELTSILFSILTKQWDWSEQSVLTFLEWKVGFDIFSERITEFFYLQES